MLFRLGHIALPKGIRKLALANLGPYWRSHLRNRQLAQGDLEPGLADAVLSRITRALGTSLPVFRREDGVLVFRDVEPHRDDWPTHQFAGRRPEACAFMHVCIGGTATLKTARATLTIRRGDVFVLNPNCRHAVTSTSLCVSLCFTVPRAAVRQLAT